MYFLLILVLLRRSYFWTPFIVVSTLISGILFARFRMVDHVLAIPSFLCDVITSQRKEWKRKNRSYKCRRHTPLSWSNHREKSQRKAEQKKNIFSFHENVHTKNLLTKLLSKKVFDQLLGAQAPKSCLKYTVLKRQLSFNWNFIFCLHFSECRLSAAVRKTSKEFG